MKVYDMVTITEARPTRKFTITLNNEQLINLALSILNERFALNSSKEDIEASKILFSSDSELGTKLIAVSLDVKGYHS